MITKENIDALAASIKPSITSAPEFTEEEETILELIAEWRARQPDEPQEHVCIHCNRDKSWHQGADQKCYYGNGKTTFEVDSVCSHCRNTKSAHHGEDLRCHLSAFHGVNTFQAEPVKEPVCRHCSWTLKAGHFVLTGICVNGDGTTTFEPLSQ